MATALDAVEPPLHSLLSGTGRAEGWSVRVACLRLGCLSLSFTSVFVFQHVSASGEDAEGPPLNIFFLLLKENCLPFCSS